MKKLIVSLALTVGVVCVASANPFTLSQTVMAGTITNIVTGPCKVTSITIANIDATNSAAVLVDTYTNTLGVATTAYTNTVSYGTNVVTYYTNYFGVSTYLTNFGLVDISNVVAASTFTWPQTPLNVLASTTYNIPNMNQTFYRGIWASNSLPAGTGGRIIITISGLTQ